MSLYLKREANGKLVLKPSEYAPEQLPTFRKLTDKQEAAVTALLERIVADVSEVLGEDVDEGRAQAYASGAQKVLDGHRRGFMGGNPITPLIAKAAGERKQNAGGTRRRSQKAEQEIAQVVMASLPVEFDLDSYLQAL
jgi:flagellar biosynthesis/type III secretory pathway protein FliH